MSDKIHPDAYEILKAATNDYAEFFEINGKKYSLVDVKAAYRAVSAALEMRDAERAEVERLRDKIECLTADMHMLNSHYKAAQERLSAVQTKEKS